MKSTFHGLETARRALMTQQYALRTVGHNIANANTPGYSRQRVNFEQTEPYPANGLNRPRIPGHLGTGVKPGSVQRIREHFLDTQYRNETNKVGYWNARYAAYAKMEDILMETEEQGLNYQINLFWTALQDLSLDPEDSGARAVVRERGKFIAETFNYYHMSLMEIKNDYGKELEETEKTINRILQAIEDINEQIRRTEPHGYVPNDLYDRQDELLDELSKYLNIKVTREKSGGKPSPVAEGPVTVIIVKDDGTPYEEGGNPIQLIDGTGTKNPLFLNISFNDDGYVESVSFENNGTAVIEFNHDQNDTIETMPRGELKALIEAYGYATTLDQDGHSIVIGIYPDMIAELNLIAERFVTEFNNIHRLGFTLPNANGEIFNGEDFFTIDGGEAAATIRVADNILQSLNNIAAAGVNLDALTEEAREKYEEILAKPVKTQEDYDTLRRLLNDLDDNDAPLPPEQSNFKPNISKAYAGDAANALRLANLKDMRIEIGGDTTSIRSYYQGVIGEMAVATQESYGKLSSATAIQQTVDFNRQAVSSVSLDEEFTLMIQYQHAYNAAARNITVIDEMLDRIINGMGIVGR